MSNIKLDLSYSGISSREIANFGAKVKKIYNNLNEIADDKKEFAGWLKLPSSYDKAELEKIKKAAKRIRRTSKVFIVIGIGGSYLGARAVIESLTSNFANMYPDNLRNSPQIFFVGNSISPNYVNELINCIGDKDVSINVISKSGTTTEPAIAFRIFREYLEDKYGAEEAAKRIYVTTDKKRGALKELANEIGGDLFEIIPKDIYTEDDLNWHNANSRSSIEIKDEKYRPEIEDINIDINF